MELIIVSGIWGIAVVLYYHAGKKIGHTMGYHDGFISGSDQVFDFFKKTQPPRKDD